MLGIFCHNYNFKLKKKPNQIAAKNIKSWQWVAFIECLLCGRCCSKGIFHINSILSYINHNWQVHFPYFTDGNGDTRKLSNLSEVSQLANWELGPEQLVRIQSADTRLCFLPPPHATQFTRITKPSDPSQQPPWHFSHQHDPSETREARMLFATTSNRMWPEQLKASCVLLPTRQLSWGAGSQGLWQLSSSRKPVPDSEPAFLTGWGCSLG